MGRVALLAGVCIALAILTGCGNDDEPATTPPATGVDADRGDGKRGGAGRAESGRAGAGRGAGVARQGQSADARAERVSIEEAIEAVLTAAGSPEEACDLFVTPEFVERSYGSGQGCRDARQPTALARSLDFKGVSERGLVAESVVVPSGGPHDGERLTVELVLAPAGSSGPSMQVWRVESVRSNAPPGP